MKTIYIFETADELVKAFSKFRDVSDKSIALPQHAKLVFNETFTHVTLENAEGFGLVSNIKAEDIIERALARCDISWSFTNGKMSRI